ncbi:hypothetical protein Tco_0546063, partial [Tanacetum coccineum]
MPLAPGVAIPEKSSHQKKVEKADQRIIDAREKKDKQVAKKAKRNDDRMETTPKKKRKKNSETILHSFESGGTLSPEPIHHSFEKKGGEGESSVVPKGTEISVVNLSKTDHEV